MLWLLELPLIVVALWAVVQLALLLHDRRRNESFFAARGRLDYAAQTTVRELQQVLVDDFKLARVDGRLKGDTAQEVRATAIKSLQALLGPLGMREVRRALGLSRKTPIDRVLVCCLEAAVHDLKDHSVVPDKVPSQPSKRFVLDTVRIPRAQMGIPEEDPESLYNEPTPKKR